MGQKAVKEKGRNKKPMKKFQRLKIVIWLFILVLGISSSCRKRTSTTPERTLDATPGPLEPSPSFTPGHIKVEKSKIYEWNCSENLELQETVTASAGIERIHWDFSRLPVRNMDNATLMYPFCSESDIGSHNVTLTIVDRGKAEKSYPIEVNIAGESITTPTPKPAN